MISHLYRYRSATSLLSEFEELERQQIFFSAPNALNDPMEGFKDLCWSGDRIVWENLLRHYLLCFMETTTSYFSLGAEFNPSVLERLIFIVPDALPIAPVRQLYKSICDAFLAEPPVTRLLDTLPGRTVPVRRDELVTYLRSVHPLALKIVISEFQAAGLPIKASGMTDEQMNALRNSASSMVDSVSGEIAKAEALGPVLAEAIFAANEAVYRQLDLIFEYGLKHEPLAASWGFLTRYFPTSYVSALEKIVYPDWYVACFSASPTNAAMWGTYGDSHRGLCLKFKMVEDASGIPSLRLNRKVGWSGSKDGGSDVYDYAPLQLQRVVYAVKYPEIDFFSSLGRIRTLDVNRFWHRGQDGTFSKSRSDMQNDEEGWRKRYWENFTKSSLNKTSDWAYEQEYRAVLQSQLFDLSAPSDRALRYKFEDLDGIVFGTNTSLEDKISVMRIIEKKCRDENRQDFEFFETRYNRETGEFRLVPVTLLKFNFAENSLSNTPPPA